MRGTPIERFMAKFIEDPTTGCWIWQHATHGSRGPAGVFWNGVAYEYAHRFSYRSFVAAIPDGFVIDHICNRRMCVNPDHLRILTNPQNVSRGKKQRTRCPQGHERTPENTYWYGDQRQCRPCALERAARTRARNRSLTQVA